MPRAGYESHSLLPPLLLLLGLLLLGSSAVVAAEVVERPRRGSICQPRDTVWISVGCVKS